MARSSAATMGGVQWAGMHAPAHCVVLLPIGHLPMALRVRRATGVLCVVRDKTFARLASDTQSTSSM